MRLPAALPAGLIVALLLSACTRGAGTGLPATTTPSFPVPAASDDAILLELELEALAGTVSRLRGLDFLEPVEVEIMADAEYRARVIGLAAPSLDLTPEQQSSWQVLLGLLPAGTNHYAATGRFLQTIDAIYDPPANRILVRLGDRVVRGIIDPYLESVVVHELVHALQFQHFGAPPTPLLDGDRAYVYSAVVEGDAQRITQRFIGELSQQEEGRYEEGRLAASEDSVAIRGGTPPYVIDRLSQPTAAGVRFLQGLPNAAIDDYLSDLENLSSLPATSEELLIPGGDLEPVPLLLPPVTVLPYERLPLDGTLGAGNLVLILGRALSEEVVQQAVAGWGADALDVRVSGSDVIFSYLFAGETAQDARELAAAFRLYLDAGPATAAYASVRVAENEVLVLAASDPSVRERLDELFAGFGEEVFLVQLG